MYDTWIDKLCDLAENGNNNAHNILLDVFSIDGNDSKLKFAA